MGGPSRPLPTPGVTGPPALNMSGGAVPPPPPAVLVSLLASIQSCADGQADEAVALSLIDRIFALSL